MGHSQTDTPWYLFGFKYQILFHEIMRAYLHPSGAKKTHCVRTAITQRTMRRLTAHPLYRQANPVS